MDTLYREELPNGVTLLHKQVTNTKIAHCGFVIDTGSRDEKLDQAGLAHFWEHMAFKGTRKRKAYHILNRIDRVGGELNAFTTKEKINFYSSSLEQHFERAVDILTDITFNSTFPEREIQKERGVILEEMSMYEDDPADAICDEFDQLLFGDHPLGRNILGERQTVQKFTKPDFDQFLHQNLDTSRTVFVSISTLPAAKVSRLVNKYMVDIPARSCERHRQPYQEYQPTSREGNISTGQAHCIIGAVAPGLRHPERITFSLLINLLGGPALNSRLNLLLREKYGYVYSVEANYSSYEEIGGGSIQFATEPKHLGRCVQLIEREIVSLQQKSLGTVQLKDAKNQFMGQMAISEESNLGYMLAMGRSQLDHGRMEPLEDYFKQVEAISASDILEVANRYWAIDALSNLTYRPS